MSAGTTPTSPAGVIEVRAVEWLIAREETQTWTEENQREFDAWLAQSPANATAFWRVEASWSRTELIADLRTYGFGISRGSERSRSWFIVLQMAAAVGLFAILGVAGTFFFRQPPEQTFATSVGGRKLITLFDGSQIELNTNTILRLGAGENQRHVTLVQGEAFFQIRHDAVNAFTVTAAGHKVVDLGTKFSMRASRDSLEVALVEGRARLEPEGGQTAEAVTLIPGDVALATAHNLTVVKKPAQILLNQLAWRKGILIFDDTPLAQAAAEFNRYNATKIVLEGLSDAHLNINGAIRIGDRKEFERLAKNLFGLHIEQREDETVIRR